MNSGTASQPMLGASFRADRNSLNAIRLGLAGVVIIDHAWSVGGYGETPHIGGLSPGGWAVAGFFSISGWLITGSRLSNDLGPYLWRRFLRIYPGMAACLCVIAFVFAPFAALIGPGHWGVGDALLFLRSDALLWIGTTTIGDSLSHNPSPNWNSQMWTLMHEFICYLIIGVFVSLIKRRHLARVCIAWLIATTLASVAVRLGILDLGRDWYASCWMGSFFAAGAILRLYRDRIADSWALVACSLALLVAAAATSAGAVFAPLSVAYLCMWAGIHLGLHRIGRRHDFSYGVYIYGLPVQQLLTTIGAHRLGLAPYAALGLLSVAPFAMASWFLIERPAAKFRKRRTIDLTRGTSEQPQDAEVFPTGRNS